MHKVPAKRIGDALAPRGIVDHEGIAVASGVISGGRGAPEAAASALHRKDHVSPGLRHRRGDQYSEERRVAASACRLLFPDMPGLCHVTDALLFELGPSHNHAWKLPRHSQQRLAELASRIGPARGEKIGMNERSASVVVVP